MEGILLFLADVASRLLTSLWFWILCLILLLGFLLLTLYRRAKLAALEKVSYTRAFSADGIFVGEELELIEAIQNPSWFPLFGVRVDFFMPSGVTVDGIVCKEYQKLTSVFHIPPFSRVQKTHVLRADRRDHYRLYNATIEYRKNEFLFSVPLDFYAYPDRYDADASLSPDLYHAGNAISHRKYIEDPFFLSGIRPYQTGDPMRSINFKASVRSFSGGMRQLMCNSYDSSRKYDSMIFLDLTAYPEAVFDGTDQIEIGLRAACFLFCEAVTNGGRVGFAANCTVGDAHFVHIPCGSGDIHSKRILEYFAEITGFAQRDYSMTALLEHLAPSLAPGTDLYLVTPFVSPKMARLLHALERAGRNVCIIELKGRRIA